MLVVPVVVPVVTQAQPRTESRERSNLEPVLGLSLLGGGYVTSVLWSYETDGDQDSLYVPVLGPWLELFSLPDCGDRDAHCAHGNSTRGVLIVSGVAQLVGAGLLVHSLADRDRDRSRDRAEPRILIAPALTSTAAGVAMRGRF
jgi:hypothetical protein